MISAMVVPTLVIIILQPLLGYPWWLIAVGAFYLSCVVVFFGLRFGFRASPEVIADVLEDERLKNRSPEEAGKDIL